MRSASSCASRGMVAEKNSVCRARGNSAITRRTIDFMKRGAQAGKPFFAYVPFTLVHYPTLPHPDFAGKTGYGDFADALAETLADAVVERVEFSDEVTFVVARERLTWALWTAHTSGFTLLTDLTAVDRHPAEPRFEVVYLLTSLERRARARLKVRVPADDPVVPSATGVRDAASSSTSEGRCP